MWINSSPGDVQDRVRDSNHDDEQEGGEKATQDRDRRGGPEAETETEAAAESSTGTAEAVQGQRGLQSPFGRRPPGGGSGDTSHSHYGTRIVAVTLTPLSEQ